MDRCGFLCMCISAREARDCENGCVAAVAVSSFAQDGTCVGDTQVDSDILVNFEYCICG